MGIGKCKIDGCDRSSFAKGMCEKHYRNCYNRQKALNRVSDRITRSERGGRQPFKMPIQQRQRMSQLNIRLCAERKAKREQARE